MAEGILGEIVAQRRLDVAAAKAAVPLASLRARAESGPAPLPFRARLEAAGPVALIAEVKRASPSKGDIAPGMDAAAQALRYARGGAAAISVLTEPKWFKGSLADLEAVRAAVELLGAARPALLRKDFVIDEYQIAEARAAGADAVLLIVACLEGSALAELMAAAGAMGLEVLVEVNSAAEMERAVAAGAKLVGVNNRDLRSFKVDLGTTGRVAAKAAAGTFVAALSGISTRADVERFAAEGARAVLVGESLMTAPDPATKIAELFGRPALVERP